MFHNYLSYILMYLDRKIKEYRKFLYEKLIERFDKRISYEEFQKHNDEYIDLLKNYNRYYYHMD